MVGWVHLGVLSVVWRRGITTSVTIGAVVDIARSGAILSHPVIHSRPLAGVLGRCGVTRRGGLIAREGWQLRVGIALSSHASRGAGMAIRIAGAVVSGAAITSGSTLPRFFLGLACVLFLLLLGLPLLSNLLELWNT